MDGARVATLRLVWTVSGILAGGAVAPARQGLLGQWSGSPGDYAGYSLARAGDVDGDGFPDLLVGDVRATTSLGTRSGVVWIASGRYLATGAGPSRLFQFDGRPNLATAPPRFGHSIAGGGDLDRDGVPDVVVGASRDDHSGIDGGSVAFYSGATGLLLTRVESPAHQAYGSAVAFAGDVDADGWVDVLVGAPVFDSTFGVAYGHAHVLSGEWIARTAAGQTPLTPRELFSRDGWWNHDDFGTAVAPLGDLDGDGRADFAVGADRGGAAGGGYFAVFLGGTSTPFVEVGGAASGDHFGSTLAACGDVDGDGIPDLCVGAWGVDAPGSGNTSHGRVEVIRGAWLLATGMGLPPTVSRAVWTRTGPAAYDLYGKTVASVGDLDQDGVTEVAVSGTQGGYGLPSSTGYVELVSGRTGAFLFRPAGNTVDGVYGLAVAAPGDLDGDGRPDVAIGAPSDSGGGTWAGMVRVLRCFPAASAPICSASATANSSGGVARLVARGSASQAASALFLELTGAPGARPAVLFRGTTATQAPFGNGVRCAGGQLLRAGAAATDPNGVLVRPFDLGLVAPGSTVVFQAWFDDAAAGGAGFNTSDAALLIVAP